MNTEDKLLHQVMMVLLSDGEDDHDYDSGCGDVTNNN